MPVSRRTMLMAAAAAAAVRPAFAQEGYPSRPVRVVVPWAPGGAVDTVARRVAQKLAEQTGQPFVVENKAGATGTIGSSAESSSWLGSCLCACWRNSSRNWSRRSGISDTASMLPASVSAIAPLVSWWGVLRRRPC